MKKSFIIISLIVSFFGILISLTPYILKVTGLDEPAKNYFINKFFAENGHYIDLNKIEIGLGKFEIDEVSFVSANEKVEVFIEKIVFDYNIFNLITSISEPHKALREIYLDQPRLILHHVAATRQTDSDSTSQNLINQIKNLYLLQSLRINDGQIVYKDKNDQYISYAQNLNGWLTSKESEKLSVSVKGSAFSANSQNFSLDLNYNNLTNQFSSRIDIPEYNFEESVAQHFVDSLFLNGTATGYAVVEGDLTKPDSINVNGNASLKNTSVTYKNEYIDDLNLEIIIEDNTLKIDDAHFKYAGNLINFDTHAGSILNPEFSGKARVENAKFTSLKKYIPADLFNGSQFNARLTYKVDKSGYLFDGKIVSDNFSFYKSEFDGFNSDFLFSGSTIAFKNITAHSENFILSGNGTFDLNRDKINVNIETAYRSDEHVLFDKISNVNHNLSIKLDINTSTKLSQGEVFYSISGFDTLLTMNGDLKANANSVWFDIKSNDHEKLIANFKVNNYLSEPNIEKATVSNFPFGILSSDKILTSFFERINTEAQITGRLNNLKGTVYVLDKTSADTIFALSTHLENVLKEHRSASGLISIKNLSGKYEADFDDEFLGSYFTFDAGIDGQFFINLKSEDELKGKINLKNFKVLKAFTDGYTADNYRNQAEINGKINISGTIKDPEVNLFLTGEKFVLNDVGYYQPRIKASINRTKLLADSITVFHNNYPVLRGSLEWGLLNNQIFGTINGKNIDVPTILNTFAADKTILTGQADYTFRLKGTSDQPHIEADLAVKNGQLDGIDFDEIEISLIDIPAEGKDVLDYENHEIELQRFFIGRKGHYHLYSVGTFPLNSQKEADLAINFDGDILGLLPHWEPFFTDGASLADIALKFKGSTDEIKLVAAEIKLERGELWMKDVARHIKDIHGSMSLKEGTKEFNIKDLTAYVDNDYLKINTVRNIKTASGKKLEHWDFKGLDIDFGILALETSGDGVLLNIPGLMQDEDLGRLSLSGKNENETFFFAGPIKHPTGYGLVTLNDAIITYPFLVSNNPSSKPSTAIQFLTNMEWDITLKAGEDVVYIRDLPAYIDNVHAEITIDESSKGLSFGGIIDKGTFKPVGSLESTRGQLEYLDQNFKVDRFALEFSRHKEYPDVSGRAWTTIRDSVGAVPKTIYLQLYAIDPGTGQIRRSGNWEDFKFKLVSADPTIGETQEQVLAYLGYSVENFKEKATNVGGALTDKYLIRPLLRPIERVLERGLGMDLVRFNSSIARNLFYSSIGKQITNNQENPFINPLTNTVPYLYLMSSSEVTLGKYLSEDLYLTYTGQLVSVYENTETGYDFNHSLGLEYRFFRNILLEFEWDRELLGYYNFENQRQYVEDFKIRLRHSFSF